eukprot:983659-Pyramimonas_sp.AAC.1
MEKTTGCVSGIPHPPRARIARRVTRKKGPERKKAPTKARARLPGLQERSRAARLAAEDQLALFEAETSGHIRPNRLAFE